MNIDGAKSAGTSEQDLLLARRCAAGTVALLGVRYASEIVSELEPCGLRFSGVADILGVPAHLGVLAGWCVGLTRFLAQETPVESAVVVRSGVH
jgi:hypothetical protein